MSSISWRWPALGLAVVLGLALPARPALAYGPASGFADHGELLALGPDGGPDDLEGPRGSDEGPPPSAWRRDWVPRDRGLRGGLDLSPGQRARLDVLRRAERGRLLAAQAALGEARAGLRALLNGPGRGPAFEARAWTLERRVIALQDRLATLRFRSLLEIRAVLADWQIRRFARMDPGLAGVAPASRGSDGAGMGY